jgi:hypothetical protein
MSQQPITNHQQPKKMTGHWIIQDIEKQIAQRNRMVIIDPSGECAYINNAINWQI